MSDFENKNRIDFDDDDFFDDEDISYQSYSSKIKGRKKLPLSTIILAILFVVLIVIIIIVVTNSAGSDDDDNNGDTTTTTQFQTTLPPNFSADKTNNILVTDKTEPTTDENNNPENNTITLLTKDDIKKGTLVLINNNNYYKYDTTQGGLQDLYGTSSAYVLSGSALKVTKPTLKNLNKWLEDFKQSNNVSGKNIIITGAFRSDAEQAVSFDQAVKYYGSEEEAKKHVQAVGYTEHHSGLCVDMRVWDGTATTQIKDNPDFKWILDNAHNYGFIQRYPEGKTELTGVAAEPEHFRYIGVAHATAMKQNNISCLESYIEYLRNFTFWGEHLFVECENGDKYEIYFSDSGTVTVPTDREYEISGNNVDGFIVTIKN